MLKFIKKLENKKIQFKLPLIGIGCGVLGMSLPKVSVNLGKYASKLLRALEYRGYDSTGAAFQGNSTDVTLLKDVGAPSTLVETLGIQEQEGMIFCGQVRWATFGAVDKTNAQPHIVRCKRFIYGAHNGNITNTRELKKFLISEGHTVLSDNDGEILVHVIEHYFDIELDNFPKKKQKNISIRRSCMKTAIIRATKKTIGSFAAVIVDPETKYSYAIKAGSSLYFGVGQIDKHNFCLASSDLTAVLRFTKQLVNINLGEFVEYNADEFHIYAYKNLKIKKLNQPNMIFQEGQLIDRKSVRSKLRAEDTELLPQFNYFMEQEIYAEVESTGKLAKIFAGGSNTGRRMLELLQREKMLDKMKLLCSKISGLDNFNEQIKIFEKYVKSREATEFYNNVKDNYSTIYDELVKEDFERKYFFSRDKNIFIDLLGNKFDKLKLLVVKAFDSIIEIEDVVEFNNSVYGFTDLIKNTIMNDRNIYTVACGTSFHATKIAAAFFNEISGIEIIPILPGDFRGQYSHCLKNNDVIIGVSQSGETKDLIDVFDDIDNLGLNIKKIVLVNNMNSTLGQEKSDVSIPIYCGPEIAVPATKSFINQLTLFYYLAVKTAETHLTKMKEDKMEKSIIEKFEKELNRRHKTINDIPLLIKETINTTKNEIDQIASKIYMEPSMHILATKLSGIAKEGALKIRETVLNHTEGGEASEFKHGPNTILGKNTVFGMKSIKNMIKYFNKKNDEIEELGLKRGLPQSEIRNISKAVSSYLFNRIFPFNLSHEGTVLFKEVIRNYDFFNPLYRNYPMIYITGPDDRDVNLTVSQINTHKIRGGDTFIIAEEDDRLLDNARLNPNKNSYYGWGYIVLPKTGDTLMTTFSATVVLQLLALKMSERKMKYLDKLSVEDHGVHPDVPKNVSKSITVD